MNNMYKIEENFPMIETDVPMPSSRRNTVWKELAEQMKIGNSVLLRNKREAQCLYSAFYDKGMRSSFREVSNGVRVWRVK